MSNILIYNNNTGITEVMSPLFAVEGYQVNKAEDWEEMRALLTGGNVQLLITDVDLKKADGIEVIRKIRAHSTIPVLVLSENDTEMTKIAALNAGADDYVVYPCNPLELLARVKSQIRRYTQLSNFSQNIEQIYQVNGLVLDDVRRTVSVDGREVRLTPMEYKILKLLVQEKGRVFSADRIYEAIWNMEAIGADNTVAVHIRHIREKIEADPKKPQYLKVVWGTGYKVG